MVIEITPVVEGETDDLERARKTAEGLIDPPTTSAPGAGVQPPAAAPAASPDPAAPATPAAPAAPVEPDPNAPPPAPSGADNLLPEQYAEIARREGKLTRGEIDLRLREERVAAKEGSMGDLQELARHDKLAAIEKLGFTFDELTRDILRKGDEGGDQTHTALAREMKRVNDKVKEIEDNQTATIAQNERTAKEQAFQRVLDNDPKLELSKFYGQEAINLALVVQEQRLKDTGQLPAPEAVLGQVEDYYLARHSDAAKLPKVQSALQPSAPQPTPAAQPGDLAPPASTDAAGQPAQPAAPSQDPTLQEGQPAAPAAPDPSAAQRTLSNAQTSNAAPVQPDSGLLSDEAYRANALAVLEQSEIKEGT